MLEIEQENTITAGVILFLKSANQQWPVLWRTRKLKKQIATRNIPQRSCVLDVNGDLQGSGKSVLRVKDFGEWVGQTFLQDPEQAARYNNDFFTFDNSSSGLSTFVC